MKETQVDTAVIYRTQGGSCLAVALDITPHWVLLELPGGEIEYADPSEVSPAGRSRIIGSSRWNRHELKF